MKALRVMIVDDDEDDREFLKAAFINQVDNPEFTEMATSQQAINYLLGIGSTGGDPATYPQLIFLDLHMPGKTGYDTLVEIKQDKALGCIPVMMLSASTLPNDRALCLAAGCHQYYIKPMSLSGYHDTAAHAIGSLAAV